MEPIKKQGNTFARKINKFFSQKRLVVRLFLVGITLSFFVLLFMSTASFVSFLRKYELNQENMIDVSTNKLESEAKNERKLKKFWIDDYIDKHNSKPILNHERLLIFRLPVGGLGDIYAGILSAFYFARFTDRILIIEDSPNFSLNTILSQSSVRKFVFSNVSQALNVTQILQPGPDKIRGFAKRALKACIKKQRSVVMSAWYKLSIDDLLSFAEKLDIKLAERLPLNLRKLEIETNRLILRELFPMPQYIIEKYKYHAREMNLQPGTYSSIHARIGLGTNESWIDRFYYTVNNMDKIASCFANLTTTERSPLKMYIASDTPEFRAHLKHAVKTKKSEIVVFEAPWENTGHSRKQSDNATLEKTNLENTMVELLLLSNSKEFWHLWSGFAVLVKRLGVFKKAMNVIPQTCTADSRDQRARITIKK